MGGQNPRRTYNRPSRRRLVAYSALMGILTGSWFLSRVSLPYVPYVVVPGVLHNPLYSLVLFLLSVLENIRNALPKVREERKRTETERDAFGQFVDRVSELDAPEVRANGGVGLRNLMAVNTRRTDEQFEAVERAYRETVMAVPHYEEEYDESFEAHMRAEFGDEIATAVITGEQFTPRVKEALVQAGTEAREQRAIFLESLEQELDTLEETKATLTDIEAQLEEASARPLRERSFDSIAEMCLRIQRLEQRCERLINQRQERIHNGRRFGLRTMTAEDFHTYLYQRLDVNYPVLSDGTELMGRLKAAKRRGIRMLTRRV